MDPRTPRRPGTGRKSPEVIARLERSRQKSLQRRAAAREKEKLLSDAVYDFIAGWNAIARCERRRENEIASLHKQIAEVTRRAAAEIEAHEREQAVAVSVIREHLATDAEAADLLEITPKRVRELLALSRGREDRSPSVPSKGVRENGSDQPAQETDSASRAAPISSAPDAAMGDTRGEESRGAEWPQPRPQGEQRPEAESGSRQSAPPAESDLSP